MRSPVAEKSRASAPTASPSASTSTSPGTSSLDSTLSSFPWRSTVEVAAVILERAATAPSALFSCTKPSTAFAMTISAMTMTSIGAPCAPSTIHAMSEIAMATNSKYTSGSWNCARTFFQRGTGGFWRSWFGPWSPRRRATASADNPCWTSTSSSATTSALSRWLGWVIAATDMGSFDETRIGRVVPSTVLLCKRSLTGSRLKV